MLQIDTKITLYTLLPFPVLSISVFILGKIIHKIAIFKFLQEYLSKLTTFGQEVFSGISVIKSTHY